MLKQYVNHAAGCGAVQPPSGGCVLKQFVVQLLGFTAVPAAFRRLCVETMMSGGSGMVLAASRLQAAVC